MNHETVKLVEVAYVAALSGVLGSCVYSTLKQSFFVLLS